MVVSCGGSQFQPREVEGRSRAAAIFGCASLVVDIFPQAVDQSPDLPGRDVSVALLGALSSSDSVAIAKASLPSGSRRSCQINVFQRMVRCRSLLGSCSAHNHNDFSHHRRSIA
ncbi:hypothetical protein N7471_009143 [Penicillium samsonianum]|uniref:uncharacterized protein n=1 Tax=Penicillium samsonianum TaxID=1882272 RepID=UPI002546E866|nr:uncharacterized protein N7471_009143 [Penicillium samsonianum]KAJ6127926.1 hypothetical protein N7471_009143 [Penicillium samsonianum]